MRRNRLSEEVTLVGVGAAAGYALGRLGDRWRIQSRKGPHIHKVPRVPIMLDGTRAAPETVRQFYGQALHYILDNKAVTEEILPVFTTPEQAQAYCDETVASPEPSTLQNGVGAPQQEMVPDPGGYVALYEHENTGGSEWVFWQSWGDIPDFTRVYCTLWWCQNINDKASAFDSNVQTWTVLHEDINYEGSTLSIRAGSLIDSLATWGWNDRASSMSYRLLP